MQTAQSHINITVALSSLNKKEDMRIPVDLTVSQFIQEVRQLFGVRQESNKYQLKVINKSLLLADDFVLKNAPLTDGDYIEILEGE